MVTASKIAETLGGKSILKERLADYTAVIQRARAGLPYAALEAVAKRYGIPPATLARVIDRKSTRLNSSHIQKSRMPSSA